MIIGSIGYPCHSGLGHIMKDFYDHGMVNRIIRINHPRYPNFDDWYRSEDTFSRNDWRNFFKGMDILLLFENAFLWDVVRKAKNYGIKIVLQPNYEYTPFPIPVIPDLVLCPSLLDREYYEEKYNTDLLPTPVNTEANPWKFRREAKVFIHNAGHGGRGFRNGTEEVLDAMRFVKSPIKLIVRGQPQEPRIRSLFDKCKTLEDPRVTIVDREVASLKDLWSEGDVSVDAQKYNGQSLPLQEAYASGMLVMTTDRYPMNTWLPREPLIPVKQYVPDKIAVKFDRAIITPVAIAETIDKWYGKDIGAYSLEGEEYAKNNCWKAMEPKYIEVFDKLLGK